MSPHDPVQSVTTQLLYWLERGYTLDEAVAQFARLHGEPPLEIMLAAQSLAQAALTARDCIETADPRWSFRACLKDVTSAREISITVEVYWHLPGEAPGSRMRELSMVASTGRRISDTLYDAMEDMRPAIEQSGGSIDYVRVAPVRFALGDLI